MGGVGLGSDREEVEVESLVGTESLEVMGSDSESFRTGGVVSGAAPLSDGGSLAGRT